MADFLKNEKERRKGIYAFAALIVMATLMLATPGMVIGVQHKLEDWTAQEMGPAARQLIDERAASIAGPVMNGGLVHFFAGSSSPFLRERGLVIAATVYSAVWRAIYFFSLIMLAIGPLGAAWYDGLRRRKISQWRYEYPSPVRHFMARSAVGRMFELLLFLAVVPIPTPPVVMLGWLIGMGIALRAWAANMQQRM